jgi:fructoselysine-6-P-deglycase FrlB-like protein
MSDREPFSTAVWKQPETLETAAREIAATIDQAEIAPWRPGETVAVVSMGASSHSANALVTALAAQGVRGVNLTASDLYAAAEGYEPGDHYVLVSESGRSPEPIEVARKLAPGRRIAVTNYAASALAEVSDTVVSYGGIPDSPVYTAGYNATLMAYSALLRAAGLPAESIDEAAVPELVRDALDRFGSEAEAIAEFFDGVESVDFVGMGYSYTSAAQGALVFREALRMPTAPYETYQYLHGPMECSKPGTGLVLFGDGRGLGVVPSQAKAGVKVLVVSAAGAAELEAMADDHVRTLALTGTASAGFAPGIAEAIAIHVVTEAIAKRRGITIEEFLYHQDDTKLDEPQAA